MEGMKGLGVEVKATGIVQEPCRILYGYPYLHIRVRVGTRRAGLRWESATKGRGSEESVRPYALRVSMYARLVVFVALQTAVNSARR